MRARGRVEFLTVVGEAWTLGTWEADPDAPPYPMWAGAARYRAPLLTHHLRTVAQAGATRTELGVVIGNVRQRLARETALPPHLVHVQVLAAWRPREVGWSSERTATRAPLLEDEPRPAPARVFVYRESIYAAPPGTAWVGEARMGAWPREPVNPS